jgi:hypothetical protein
MRVSRDELLPQENAPRFRPAPDTALQRFNPTRPAFVKGKKMPGRSRERVPSKPLVVKNRRREQFISIKAPSGPQGLCRVPQGHGQAVTGRRNYNAYSKILSISRRDRRQDGTLGRVSHYPNTTAMHAAVVTIRQPAAGHPVTKTRSRSHGAAKAWRLKGHRRPAGFPRAPHFDRRIAFGPSRALSFS